MRNRKTDESVSAYGAELWHLSQYSEYGNSLDSMLRDRLVCGINHDRTQQRLQSEGATLTLQKALDISLSLESAIQQSAIMHNDLRPKQEVVAKVEKKPNSTSKCYRCDGQHSAKVCPFIEKQYFYCKNKGHTLKVCRNKVKDDSLKRLTKENNDHEEDDAIYSMYYFSSQKPRPPIIIKISVAGCVIPIEVDTGASTNIINLETFEDIRKRTPIKLNTFMGKLKTCSGDLISPKGEAVLEFLYEGKPHVARILVAEDNYPNLLGRDVPANLRLDWQNIFNAHQMNCNNVDEKNLKEIISAYENVFSKELGALKGVEVDIPVDPNVKPMFFRARPVPYSLRDKIEKELERLVKQGVYEPVASSKWADPIVPVLKDDGSVRICGDYKQTVNKAAACDKYTVPKMEDIFATIVGGGFSKLDLSQAYQQLVLSPGSRELLTINTHKGPFQPTRLQFGVHSASGIFQRELENRLATISFIEVRSDDILVSGKNNKEHLVNLEKILKILHDSGLKLKLSKCSFMQPEVIYLGFKINKHGVYPIKEKIDSIKNARIPQNVSELKSFLGLLNYYHRHFRNFTEVLVPLHKLVRKDVKWEWGDEQNIAFQKAKNILCESSYLVHYDPQKPLILACDASPYGLGAVLSHEFPDGSEKPITFASRTLSKAERNYSQIEKEALSIVYAIKKFHQYLFGRLFYLYTDHKPLLRLFSEDKAIPNMAAVRMQRWALSLSAYDYTLKYKAGLENSNADFFSRYPSEDESEYSKVNNNVYITKLVTSISYDTARA